MRGRQGKAPVKKRQSTVQRPNKQQVIQVTEQFSGPILPPDTLYHPTRPGPSWSLQARLACRWSQSSDSIYINPTKTPNELLVF